MHPVAARGSMAPGRRVRPMTEDQERWVEALAILRQKGDDAPRLVAERLGVLARRGDSAGVERFRAVASRMERMITGTVH